MVTRYQALYTFRSAIVLLVNKRICCIWLLVHCGLQSNDEITSSFFLWVCLIILSIQDAKGVRETAYNTLVRPQLEYASAVWDPHNKGRISHIEQVQRRAARWTVNNFARQASVTRIVQDLGWRTLDQRRADARLCLFYKIVHGLVAVPLPEYIQYSNRVSRYCHSMTFRQVSTSTDYYKYSFFPLAIVQWNALPQSVASSQSLEVFKTAVCKLQHSRP